MAKYGIPYMGSKGPLADKLLPYLPSADNFYDLFGGGFSMTHAAMLSKKWNHFYFNEIQPGICDLLQKAINGEFNYEIFKPEWISREMFFDRKDHDAYVRTIWSFGNNQKDYLFGKDIESKKKSLHQAVVFDEFDSFAIDVIGFDKWTDKSMGIKEKRLFCRKKCIERNDPKQLEQLERLERLEQPTFYNADYRDVVIKQNSIVYCDPPYKGTSTYSNENPFNHKEFYEWCRNLKHPLFVSEYQMPDDFIEILSINKVQKLVANAKNGKRRVYQDKLYTNKLGYDLLKSQNPLLLPYENKCINNSSPT